MADQHKVDYRIFVTQNVKFGENPSHPDRNGVSVLPRPGYPCFDNLFTTLKPYQKKQLPLGMTQRVCGGQTHYS